MIDHSIAVQIAGAMKNATDSVLADVQAGDIGDEDDFSSQLCASLKRAIEGKIFLPDQHGLSELPAQAGRASAVQLHARHLTWRGPRGEETRFGADIIMVLDINLSDYRATKGLLIQTKHLAKGARFSEVEFRRLNRQSRDMLLITPAAFVLVYSQNTVDAYSANAVSSSKSRDLKTISTYPLEVLYQDFTICWEGDKRLHATDQNSLRQLLEQYVIRESLLVKVRRAKV